MHFDRSTRNSLSLLALMLWPIMTEPARSSEFSGTPKVELGGDGINVTLIEEFSFTDREKYLWFVPSGAVVNGASIPQPFFSLIGGPLSGKYRDASIVHDYYCEPKNRIFDSNRVHDVFHQSMIASGVSPAKAFIMHEAVKKFGPQWTEQQGRCTNHDVWQEASANEDPMVLKDLVDLCVQNSSIPAYEPNKRVPNDAAVDFLRSLKGSVATGIDVDATIDEFVELISSP